MAISTALKRFGPLVALTALILISVLLPQSLMPKAKNLIGMDKLAHFGLFFLWSLALARAWSVLQGFLPLIVIALVFAIATESLQLAITDRNFEWLDALADGIGALAAYFVLTLRRRYRLAPARMDK